MGNGRRRTARNVIVASSTASGGDFHSWIYQPIALFTILILLNSVRFHNLMSNNNWIIYLVQIYPIPLILFAKYSPFSIEFSFPPPYRNFPTFLSVLETRNTFLLVSYSNAKHKDAAKWDWRRCSTETLSVNVHTHCSTSWRTLPVIRCIKHRRSENGQENFREISTPHIFHVTGTQQGLIKDRWTRFPILFAQKDKNRLRSHGVCAWSSWGSCSRFAFRAQREKRSHGKHHRKQDGMVAC